jgi:hypothetical protein
MIFKKKLFGKRKKTHLKMKEKKNMIYLKLWRYFCHLKRLG